MKLISMTDYVLEQMKEVTLDGTGAVCARIGNYANFLKQPLTLAMFVPCDLDGNVLEEPSKKDMEWFKGLAYGDFSCDYTRIFEFIEAKERVLFEFDGDLSLIKNVTNFYIIEDKNGVYYRVLKNNTKTKVEDLLKFSVEITLTETAIKQIGL
ncbi:hypothetical protein ACTS9E_04260 [Empedobacter brevis]